MKELPADEYFKCRDLFAQIIKEMNGRLTADEAIMKYHRAASAKCLSIFVDSDDPKQCVILSHYPGTVDSGFVCAVIMRYASPQVRTQEFVNESRRIIEEYAVKNKCEIILGSAWKWDGARGIDSIWTSEGYKIQETVYAKVIV